MPATKTTDLVARIYRALLVLYPDGTRSDVAADMEECFRDLCRAADRDRGGLGVVAVALRTYAELPMSAWRARAAARKTMTTKKGASSMETFLQDVRYAVRGLLRNRGFTTLAVLSLAVGVGANTSMFSLAKGILWRELPVPEADRLVRLFEFRPIASCGCSNSETDRRISRTLTSRTSGIRGTSSRESSCTISPSSDSRPMRLAGSPPARSSRPTTSTCCG